jgi:hypothetical protein
MQNHLILTYFTHFDATHFFYTNMYHYPCVQIKGDEKFITSSRMKWLCGSEKSE